MIIPADRQGEEDTVLAQIRAGEAVTHFETIRQRKDGTLHPDLADRVARPRRRRARHRRVEDRARHQRPDRRPRSAARRLAAVVESSDDAIVTKTLNGIITSWNPAAERMFGYTAAEAIGRSIRMIIPDDLQGEEDVVLAQDSRRRDRSITTKRSGSARTARRCRSR